MIQSNSYLIFNQPLVRAIKCLYHVLYIYIYITDHCGCVTVSLVLVLKNRRGRERLVGWGFLQIRKFPLRIPSLSARQTLAGAKLVSGSCHFEIISAGSVNNFLFLVLLLYFIKISYSLNDEKVAQYFSQ